VLIDRSDRQLGLLVILRIWRDQFLGVSPAFVVIHDGVGGRARWMLWSEDIGQKLVDLSFFPDFVDEMLWIFV
jgi:hypothetical protein